MKRENSRVTRARKLIREEKAPGYPVVRMPETRGRAPGTHKTWHTAEPPRARSLEATPPLIGREIVGTVGGFAVSKAILRYPGFLIAASKRDAQNALISAGGRAQLDTRIAEIVSARDIPDTSELVIGYITPANRGATCMLTVDSARQNLEWINPLREGLGLSLIPASSRLSFPLFPASSDRRALDSLNSLTEVPLTLGPVMTNDTQGQMYNR